MIRVVFLAVACSGMTALTASALQTARNGTIPARGVPSGCDGAAMSAKYWQVWNADEQAKIDADIERNRKADATVAIDAPDGAEVAVEQLDHEFRFGAHIFNFNQLGRTEWNDAYKASYGHKGVFNQATVAFYWKQYEPQAGKLRAQGEYADSEEFWNGLPQDAAESHFYWRRPSPGPVIDFLKAQDVFIHGHILVWGSERPFWLYDRYCPEAEKRRLDALGVPRHSRPSPVVTDNWSGGYEMYWRQEWQKVFAHRSEAEIVALAPRYAANLRRLFTKRVSDVAAAFGDAVDSWDVVNESAGDWERYHDSETGLPIWKSVYGIMPGDYPLQALRDAKAAFPSEARLCINDYRIKPVFVEQVRDLARHGAKIDVIGCQMHIFETNDCMRLAQGETDVNWVGTPKVIEEKLDLMAQAGRPVHISEVTITSPGADVRSRQIQAILLRNIYRKWFSHRSPMGITWWNTVDGGGAKGEPRVSGLFTRDLKRKPAYNALDELVNREWKTRTTARAKDGYVSFRGFRGRYRLTWTSDEGETRAVVVEVTGEKTRVDERKVFPKIHYLRDLTVDGKPVKLSRSELRLDLAKIYPDGVGNARVPGSRWAEIVAKVVRPQAGRVAFYRQNEFFGELFVNGRRAEGSYDGPYDIWTRTEIDLREGENEIRFRTRAGCSGNWFCGLAVGE